MSFAEAGTLGKTITEGGRRFAKTYDPETKEYKSIQESGWGEKITTEGLEVNKTLDENAGGVSTDAASSPPDASVDTSEAVADNIFNQEEIDSLSFGAVHSNNRQILDKDKTKSIINSDEIKTGEFTRDKDFFLPFDKMKENLISVLGRKNVDFIPSNTIANKILGDSILSNMFIVGKAYQSGCIPINAKAIEHAIKLNGVTIEENIHAFRSVSYTHLRAHET